MRYELTTRPFDFFEELDKMMNFAPSKVVNARSFAIDFEEAENGFLLTADLPGVNEKDLEVSVEKDVMKISINSKNEKEKKEKNYLVKERSEFRAERRIRLPENASSEDIEAELKNGILTVSIKKKEETKPKTITIKSA
ncbi:MAG: Hsp20/alpha crystallin family protein [Spirochaetales bacterium]|nr:Hsp20/alpha crystallin family protein [Spirochaetales bacterium]